MVVFGLLVIYFLIRWKVLTNSWLKRNYGKNNLRRSRRNPLVQVKQLYNGYFGVEKGKYYLWRMYIFEFIENWIQFFNMRTIYLCMLPLEYCIIFASILICESMYRAYIMAKKLWLSKQGQDQITVREKDFQLGVDIFVDSFFLLTPIAITFLGYDLRPSIEDITWMLFFPMPVTLILPPLMAPAERK